MRVDEGIFCPDEFIRAKNLFQSSESHMLLSDVPNFTVDLCGNANSRSASLN